ncbi:MAG: crotonase/enoyl-CoA hydratase family protein [Pseudomonadota bacterium]
MGFESIAVGIDPRGVALLTLSRGEKHNALDARMIAEVTEAAGTLAADPEVRAVVLTGAGRSFCAGGDLGWMRAQMDADRAQRISEARKLAEMLRALDRMPKPLIGRINGQAFGGGVGLISVTDHAIAVDTARFGLTETRLGLIPATIGPYVVARLGAARSRRVFASPHLFGAEVARDLGLLGDVVAEDALDDTVEAAVAPYLTAAPGATADAKRLLADLAPTADDAAIERSIQALADRWETAEATEGIAAFFEKRPAPWMRDGP